jgi:hypothetical protein
MVQGRGEGTGKRRWYREEERVQGRGEGTEKRRGYREEERAQGRGEGEYSECESIRKGRALLS